MTISPFTLYSQLRSQVECDTPADPLVGNFVLYSTAHQKADRGSAILAANGPDRRVGGIVAFWLQSAFWSDSTDAPIGTVRGQDG